MTAGSPSRQIKPGRLKLLLFSLLLLLVIYPWFGSGGINSKILNIFTTLILLAGIYVASSNRRRLIIAIFLVLPALSANWANTIFENTSLALASNFFGTLFFVFAALTILSTVLKAKEVTVDIMCGAISVYLLIGIAWSGVYSFLETLYPGSFYIGDIHNADNVLNISDFIYYSFVTLTTLGYGDIIPVSPRARSIAILEAITGVLFMAVLIARLVGTYIAQQGDSSGN